MKKNLILFKSLLIIISLIYVLTSQATAQNIISLKTEITKVMRNQEKSWNNGDMEAYMQGYWQSDSLRFLSNNKLTYGWKQQLANYKKGYPDKSVMGILKFDILSIERLGINTALVIGTYKLKRQAMEDAFGYYSLIWEKKDGKWVIVFDHSS